MLTMCATLSLSCTKSTSGMFLPLVEKKPWNYLGFSYVTANNESTTDKIRYQGNYEQRQKTKAVSGIVK